MIGIVDEPGGFTSAWCTGALRAQGLDVTVTDVTVEPVGTGHTGASYRLVLSYAGAPIDAPSTLIGKIAAGSEEARRRVGAGYRTEVEFYRQLAATVDVRTPACRFAAIADDNTRFTLLLDEVVDARPGVQVEGCSSEQARAVVDNAAALHAPWWNDPRLHEMSFLGSVTPSRASFVSNLQRRCTTEFVDRFGDVLAPGDRATLERVAEVAERWHLARPVPFAPMHGDFRLDNFMFELDGPGVTVLDWQTLTVGPPVRDVAYFLGTSLPTDLRRLEETELLDRYHGRLVERGVTDYEIDDCRADYRLGLLQGPYIAVIGAALATAERTERGDEMFLAMIRRSCAAIRDHDSLALVDDVNVEAAAVADDDGGATSSGS